MAKAVLKRALSAQFSMPCPSATDQVASSADSGISQGGIAE